MTDAEWVALSEDETGELVDGELVEEEVPSWAHEAVVVWLIRLLGAWASERSAFLAASEAKYLVRRGRGRKPDLSLFLSGSRPPPRRGPLRRPSDLMVEVVSEDPKDARRDRIDKMAEYASFGVRWYWIVDPQIRTFEIFQLGDDGNYARIVGVSAGRVEPVPGLEGLALDLDSLWGELDRLGPPEDES
jgi:Uma2 family endonuclease